MLISPDVGEVRAIVRRIFGDLGVEPKTMFDLSETILVDEGRIRARSYRVEDLMAMWMIDLGILQFYDAEGNMLRRANLFSESGPRRMAA